MFDFWNEVVIWAADPVAFSLPMGISVRWYGLVYGLGAIGAMWLVPFLASRFSNTKLTKKEWEDTVFYGFLWGVVGGRFFNFLFYYPEVFWQNPLEVLQIWNGGMTIHGGILGTVLYLIWRSRRLSISFWSIADMLVFPLAVILIFGRLANWANGEIIGTPTNRDWGVIFPFLDKTPRHPIQLYSSMKNVIVSLILGLFMYLDFGKKKAFLSSIFLISYGAIRMFLVPFRETESMIFNIPMGQFLSGVMVILGCGILAWSVMHSKMETK